MGLRVLQVTSLVCLCTNNDDCCFGPMIIEREREIAVQDCTVCVYSILLDTFFLVGLPVVGT